MNELLNLLSGARIRASLRPTAWRKPNRVLYVVNHSLPFSSNGYAIRTHGVAAALVRAGVEVIAVSRPGVPWDRPGFCDDGFEVLHHIDGVRYLHLRHPSQIGKVQFDYVTQSEKALGEVLRVFNPSVVMAASNWLNALPAALAAQRAGLPFFYEVRGFWEISRASREPAWAESAQFDEVVKGETAVATAAARVFTLNRQMREELIQRGVPAPSIALVPNGFPGWPEPPSNDTELSRAALGSRARFLVGYIGSFNGYEGLEDLIEAVAWLRGGGVDVDLLLVGSGETMGVSISNNQREGCVTSLGYRQLADRLGIAEHLFMPGRVSPSETATYYEMLDVVVIPRRPVAVSEIVSPIKPLEAAAHGKRVLMSDVAPLADLVELCQNFSCFSKGSVASLVNKLMEILQSPLNPLPRCQALGGRTWDNNIRSMVSAIQEFGP